MRFYYGEMRFCENYKQKFLHEKVNFHYHTTINLKQFTDFYLDTKQLNMNC